MPSIYIFSIHVVSLNIAVSKNLPMTLSEDFGYLTASKSLGLPLPTLGGQMNHDCMDFLEVFIWTFILRYSQLMYCLSKSENLVTFTCQEVQPGQSLVHLLSLG